MSFQPFKNIAIGVAFSPNLKANLHEAARLSLFFKARLSLIHVGKDEAHKREKVAEYLEDFKDQSLDYTLHFKEGKPVEVILNHIEDRHIDLIILGAVQKENLLKYYVGSIARKITRQANCSVLLLIKPSISRVVCSHVVVNGLEDKHTQLTINTAFFVAYALKSEQITIVEEIQENQIAIKIDDDASLRKANLLKEKLRRKENMRVDRMLEQVQAGHKKEIRIKKQPIFGTRGYSIGHYAHVVRADLLVMNAPEKTGFWDRLFPHDIEYILTDLPTDILIVR